MDSVVNGAEMDSAPTTDTIYRFIKNPFLQAPHMDILFPVTSLSDCNFKVRKKRSQI
jgi:hypothetical protein